MKTGMLVLLVALASDAIAGETPTPTSPPMEQLNELMQLCLALNPTDWTACGPNPNGWRIEKVTNLMPAKRVPSKHAAATPAPVKPPVAGTKRGIAGEN